MQLKKWVIVQVLYPTQTYPQMDSIKAKFPCEI